MQRLGRETPMALEVEGATAGLAAAEIEQPRAAGVPPP